MRFALGREQRRKVAIWLALAVVLVGAVLALEIELLHNGALVVVMPD